MLRYLLVVHMLPFTCAPSLPDLGEVSTFIQQASADFDFGNAQVEQFVRDRPGTARIIERHPMLRHLLIWKFSGELSGERIYWDKREPDTFEAVHLPSYSGYPALVRVSKDLAAVDQCVAVLFELFNCQNDPDFDRLCSNLSRKVPQDDFIASCVRLEFQAMEKVRHFFVDHPIRADLRDAKLYLGAVHGRADFETYFTSLDQDGDYIEHYKKQYRSWIAYNEKMAE